MEDARGSVLRAAFAEARQRGDRRLGSEHLFLGLLHDPDAAQLLGVDLASAHQALAELDRDALAAVGIDVSGFDTGGLAARPATGRRQALTSAARAVLLRSITASSRGRRRHRPEPKHVLLALLACERPDPAAALIAKLGIDADAVRARLS